METQRMHQAKYLSYWQNNNVAFTVEVCIDTPKKNEVDHSWFCSYWIIGFDDGNRFDIIGGNAIQAISLALQMIKFTLINKLDEGYTLCELSEDKTINKMYSKRESTKILNSNFGNGTMLDKAHTQELCLQAIERLLEAKGLEQDQDYDINFLKKHIADPKIIDYIFNDNVDMSAEEILQTALEYKPIVL
jgi:hypothetical protein